MIVYIPVYDHGWKTVEINTDIARLRRNSVDGRKMIFYHGTIYDGESLFNCPAAVDMWVAKNYHESQKYSVNADTVKWAMVG